MPKTQINLPDTVQKRVKEYQGLYKRLHGSHISIPDVISFFLTKNLIAIEKSIENIKTKIARVEKLKEHEIKSN